MDGYGQPDNSKARTYIIAGSIAAVVVGLVIVGAIVYRARALSTGQPSTPGTGGTTAGQPSLPGSPSTGGSTTGQPRPGGGSTGGTPGSSGTPGSPGTTGSSGGNVPPTVGGGPGNAPPDYTNASDSDKDGLTDPEEALYGTDPHKTDTDGDGFTDYDEVRVYGSDPLDPKSIPAPPKPPSP